MSKIVNLTPHVLNISCGEGAYITIPPTAPPARVVMETRECGELTIGIPGFSVTLYMSVPVEIRDLPDPAEDTYYITSYLVAQAVARRPDVLSPGELVRDSTGQPIGCKGLQRHY